MIHILLVDDDPKLSSLTRTYLCQHGFCVSTCSTVRQAREALKIFRFHAMVLDVMLPDMTGFEFLKSSQKMCPPTLMLSALNTGRDRIQGLRYGATDYLGKPFEPEELVLRLKNIAVRFECYTFKNGVIYNPTSEECLDTQGQNIALTSQERRCLRILWDNQGKVALRSDLAKTLQIHTRSLDTMIRRLRQKLETSPQNPECLITVWGKGYQLKPL